MVFRYTFHHLFSIIRLVYIKIKSFFNFFRYFYKKNKSSGKTTAFKDKILCFLIFLSELLNEKKQKYLAEFPQGI
jgi:hypothetical protein